MSQDPTPDDGKPYQDPPAPGYTAPTPYGAVEGTFDEQPQPSAWGTPTGPPAQAPAGPPAQPPTSPYLNRSGPAHQQPFTGAPGNNPRRGCATGVVIAVAVGVLVIGLFISLIARTVEGGSGGTGSDPTTSWTDPDAIGQTWSVSVSDLSATTDESGIGRHPDGAFTGPRVIADEGAWVIAWTDEEYVNQGIAGIAPADGAVLWERPLAQVACADQQLDGTLLCLALDHDTWVFHHIDALTGEDLTAVETELDDVQTVHAHGDVLVAVGPADPAPHAMVTGLDVDGSMLWSFDIAELEDADLMFDHFYDSAGEPVLERPRWRDLDDGRVMLWATPGVAIIDTATGETFVHECRSATPMQDHYYCVVKERLERYELDGTRTWTAPDLRPAVPEDDSDTRLVALSEPTANQFEIVPLDPETGEVTGAATFRFAQQPGTWTGIVLPPAVYAEPDATFIVGDLEVLALDPESGELLWSLPLDEIYMGEMVQVGDLAVLNAGDLIGIDLGTGEVLWEQRYRGDVSRIDDALISVSSDEIALLEVP